MPIDVSAAGYTGILPRVSPVEKIGRRECPLGVKRLDCAALPGSNPAIKKKVGETSARRSNLRPLGYETSSRVGVNRKLPQKCGCSIGGFRRSIGAGGVKSLDFSLDLETPRETRPSAQSLATAGSSGVPVTVTAARCLTSASESGSALPPRYLARKRSAAA